MLARILIVDDHALLREGLAMLIEDEPDMTVCGTATDAEDALTKFEELSPDVVTLDLSMPGMNGLELLKHVKSRFPATHVLVVSMHQETTYAERCLRAGAEGYVMKKEPPEVVVDGIRKILRGDIAVSTTMTTRMLRRVHSGSDAEGSTAVDALTDRELEVYELLGEGRASREIAEQLNLSIKTIHYYREAIKQKLGLQSAAALTHSAYAWVHGLSDGGSLQP